LPVGSSEQLQGETIELSRARLVAAFDLVSGLTGGVK
jgi:hypothetical protein